MARRNTQASPGFMIFIGIVMVVMSMVIFTTGNNTKKMHKRCTQSTNGIVQSVTRQRRTRKSGKHRRTTYYVYLTGYEFEVNSKPIHGSSTLQSGERLSEGANLTVYYNPSDPDNDHYTRYDDTGTGGMVASVFVGLTGVILFVSGIKTKASRRSMGGVRGMAAGAVLSGMNGNNNYNSNYNNYNYNSTNSFNNNYNNGFSDTNSYNNYNNGYNNNNSYNTYDSNGFNNNNNGYNNNNSYNNGYSNDYNNNYNNNYNNSYNNNNVYSGSSNNYNDFNQLN